MPPRKDIKVYYYQYEVAQQMVQLCRHYHIPTAADPLLYAIDHLKPGKEFIFLCDYVQVVSEFMGVTPLSLLDHVIAKNFRDPYVNHSRWNRALDRLRQHIINDLRANGRR